MHVFQQSLKMNIHIINQHINNCILLISDNINDIQNQDIALEIQQINVVHSSQAIPGIIGRSTAYVDEHGFNYYQHSIRRETR